MGRCLRDGARGGRGCRNSGGAAWREVGAAGGGYAENEQRTNKGKSSMLSLENALAMGPMVYCVPDGAGGVFGVFLSSRTVRAAPCEGNA